LAVHPVHYYIREISMKLSVQCTASRAVRNKIIHLQTDQAESPHVQTIASLVCMQSTYSRPTLSTLNTVITI